MYMYVHVCELCTPPDPCLTLYIEVDCIRQTLMLKLFTGAKAVHLCYSLFDVAPSRQ